MSNKYDIALGFDNQQNYALALIKNIINKSDTKELFFHIFVDLKTDFEWHEDWLLHFGVNYKIYRMTSSDIKNSKTNSKVNRLTNATLYRIFMAEKIDESVEYFSYLDTDLYINFDIRELFIYTKNRTTLVANSSEQSIFNSGVLLINRKQYLENLDLDLLNTDKPIDDQLFLFANFRESTSQFPTLYNFPIEYYVTNKKRYNMMDIYLKDAKVIHFMGSLKPWRFSTKLPYTREWRENYITVFNEKPWLKEITLKELILWLAYRTLDKRLIFYSFYIIRKLIIKNTPI
jgi:lipopolysaccharide biosynthesis glycosyltransferase